VSGPKSVSYAVDPAVLRRQQALVWLNAQRATLVQRELALAAVIRSERARHGEAVNQLPRLAMLDATGSVEQQEREVAERSRQLADLERRAEQEAAGARRAQMTRALDGVLVVAATEATPDGSIERMRARQAKAGEASYRPGADLSETVERNLARLAAGASPEAAESVVALASEALEASSEARAALVVQSLRAAIDAENRRVAARAQARARAAAWRERLAAYAGPAVEGAFAELDAAGASAEGVTDELDRRLQQLADAEEARAARDYTVASVADVLDELGYEVGESFDSVLVQDGYADIRRGDWPGYAVRVRLSDERPALMFNVVRGEAAATQAVRDHEVETAWCSSLDDIRTRLGEAGVRTGLTRSLPAGAQAVQIVGDLPGPLGKQRRRQRLKEMRR
jgi:hypothetical protein